MTEAIRHPQIDRRRVAVGVFVVTALAALVIANSDRRFYADAGYNTEIRPSYWTHAALMAFYAGGAFLLARAPRWKSALVIVAALSFGLWSGFVVDAALGLQGTGVGDGIDRFVGRGGAASLLTGIVAGGLATAGWFGVLTRSARVGALFAGVTLLSGVVAAMGWGEAAGQAGSTALLMASSFGWHLGVASVLLGWAMGPGWIRGGSVQSAGKFGQ